MREHVGQNVPEISTFNLSKSEVDVHLIDKQTSAVGTTMSSDASDESCVDVDRSEEPSLN